MRQAGGVSQRYLISSLFLVFAAGILFTLASEARAGNAPPPWALVWHDISHQLVPDVDVRVVYLPTLPQARLASLDGVSDPVPVARGLPWGLNRGTCNPNLVPAAVSETVDSETTLPTMTSGDLGCIAAALVYLPEGRSIAWLGSDGAVKQVTTFDWHDGDDTEQCRDIVTSTFVDGRMTNMGALACRKEDGRWRLTNH